MLEFTDGTKVDTEFLIGADGAFSKVRPLLSDAKPEYVGIASVETYLYDVDEKHRETADIVGDGAMYALAPGKGFQSHREPNNIIHTYVSLKRSDDWFDKIDFQDSKDAITKVGMEFEGWPETLTKLIKSTETQPVLRKVYVLPIGHQWEHASNITLIGDAAHLMPPAGEGANLALLDGAELAMSIVNNRNNLKEAIIQYEKPMFARSEKAAIEANEFLDIILGERTPYQLADILRETLDGK
ncbi:FAD-dependent oxidoreductase [Staphylococcus carnosus]|uniref:FAD-dependent oxidoreductase n=1 Tax=Staphylococcus carnosus TaxID=1281 RepID=UPI0030021B15